MLAKEMEQIATYNMMKMKMRDMLLSKDAVEVFEIDWSDESIDVAAIEKIVESAMDFIKTRFATIQKKG